MKEVLSVADKKDAGQRGLLAPVKGLLGVALMVVAFLAALAGITFLVYFLLE